MLKENKLELQKFRKEVRNCVDELLKTIKENKLKVVACEKFINTEQVKNMRKSNLGALKINGSIDMILEDQNGKLYIFDFKWSSSKKYEKLLKENRSMQLALYKEMVEQEYGRKVETVAYFLMPSGTFVSCDNLKGAINMKSVFVTSERQWKNILQEIVNSYNYRKEEIFSGKLEENSGWEKDAISYEEQVDKKKLLPMDYYKDVKNSSFNDIGLIKTRK